MNRRDAIKAAAASVAAMAVGVVGKAAVSEASPVVESAYWQVTSTYVNKGGRLYHMKSHCEPIPMDVVPRAQEFMRECGTVNGEWKCVGHETRVVNEPSKVREWFVSVLEDSPCL